MSDNYLIHWAKGSTSSDHKYIARKWVNGAWQYIYDKISGNDKKTSENDEELNQLIEDALDAKDHMIQLKELYESNKKEYEYHLNYARENRDRYTESQWKNVQKALDNEQARLENISSLYSIAAEDYNKKTNLANEYSVNNYGKSLNFTYMSHSQDSDYLIHHGIQGQKWGVQNGPPYPLDYKDLSPEERAKDKERAIAEGDTRTAQKNAKYFTNQEMQNLLTRFDQNTRLSQLNEEKIKTGKEKMDEFIDNWGKGVKIANLAVSSWNIISGVGNAINSEWNIPSIKIGGGKK